MGAAVRPGPDRHDAAGARFPDRLHVRRLGRVVAVVQTLIDVLQSFAIVMMYVMYASDRRR